MIDKKIETAINNQVNAELWSAYLYESMSLHFAAEGLPGFANWFHIQFREEQDHATKFMSYIISRGGRVTLKAIDTVPNKWKSPLVAFQETLKHEIVVTGLINDIYALALKTNDVATQSMLKWYIDEQVEEEENAQALIDQLSLIKDNGYGLLMLDKELAQRVYVPLTTGSAN